MQGVKETERRQFPRIQKRIMVKIDDKPGLLLDISRGGMRISSSVDPVNKEVNIKLQAADRIFSVFGEVRWVDRKYSVQNLKDIGVNVIAAEVSFFRYLDRILPEREVH